MNPLALTAFLFQYGISPRRQSLEAIEATRHSGTLLQHQEERTHSKNGINGCICFKKAKTSKACTVKNQSTKA